MLLKPETQWRSQSLLRQKEDYVRSLINMGNCAAFQSRFSQ